MATRAVTLRKEGALLCVERSWGEPLALCDLLAVLPGSTGRLKVFAVGQTRAELEGACATGEEQAALSRCELLPVFEAEGFSVVRVEALMRYLFFSLLGPQALQPGRPSLRLWAPPLQALTPTERQGLARCLRRFGSPVFLNGRRL